MTIKRKQLKNIDLVYNFYKNRFNNLPIRHEPFYADMVTISPQGVGDTTVITQMPKNAEAVGKKMSIFSYSKFFGEMMLHNKYYDAKFIPQNVLSVESIANYNWGGGHTIQRMCKAFGVQVDHEPRGYFNEQYMNRLLNSGGSTRIGLHLSTGNSAWSNTNHHQPRQIYKENVDLIDEFIEENPQYTFFEFGGHRRTKSDSVIDLCGISISSSISYLATCDYFIGTNSGFMNIAAALGVDGIIIVNWPEVHELYLPHLVYSGIGDIEWLYPQNVHLHQDGENELVPKFSKNSLKAAIMGEVYPYWNDNLINNLLPEFDAKNGFNFF